MSTKRLMSIQYNVIATGHGIVQYEDIKSQRPNLVKYGPEKFGMDADIIKNDNVKLARVHFQERLDGTPERILEISSETVRSQMYPSLAGYNTADSYTDDGMLNVMTEMRRILMGYMITSKGDESHSRKRIVTVVSPREIGGAIPKIAQHSSRSANPDGTGKSSTSLYYREEIGKAVWGFDAFFHVSDQNAWAVNIDRYYARAQAKDELFAGPGEPDRIGDIKFIKAYGRKPYKRCYVRLAESNASTYEDALLFDDDFIKEQVYDFTYRLITLFYHQGNSIFTTLADHGGKTTATLRFDDMSSKTINITLDNADSFLDGVELYNPFVVVADSEKDFYVSQRQAAIIQDTNNKIASLKKQIEDVTAELKKPDLSDKAKNDKEKKLKEFNSQLAKLQKTLQK